jgi:hypothetical protein
MPADRRERIGAAATLFGQSGTKNASKRNRATVTTTILRYCTVVGCNDAAKVKGMCSKHYMRQRRHGNTGTVRKPGVKPPPWLMFGREGFREWSERKIATWTRAMKIFSLLGLSAEDVKAISAPGRPTTEDHRDEQPATGQRLWATGCRLSALGLRVTGCGLLNHDGKD